MALAALWIMGNFFGRIVRKAKPFLEELLEKQKAQTLWLYPIYLRFDPFISLLQQMVLPF